jgi:hypothetical protein
VVLSKSTVVKGLEKKGFELDKNSHHRWFRYFTPDGRKSLAKTKVSQGRGSEDLDTTRLKLMGTQCGLDTSRQFADLVKCPLSRDEFEQIIVSKGLIP